MQDVCGLYTGGIRARASRDVEAERSCSQHTTESVKNVTHANPE